MDREIPAVTRKRVLRFGEKVFLSLALICVAAAIVGVGAFATFTDSESAAQSVGSGTVDLDPITPSGPNNRLSIGASNIAAGDTIQRAVLVKNSGSVALASSSGIVLGVTATSSSALDTPGVAGQTLETDIDRCSVAWTEAGGPPYTYTCGGVQTSVIADQPVVGSYDLSSSLDLTGGADNFLRVTVELPAGAPNALQGLTSVLQYTFTATQRAGQAQ